MVRIEKVHAGRGDADEVRATIVAAFWLLGALLLQPPATRLTGAALLLATTAAVLIFGARPVDVSRPARQRHGRGRRFSAGV